MTYAQTIAQELRHIRPADLLELDHLTRAQAWVASGAPLCRLRPPATPPMHLVSYFPVIDQGQVLLGAHITSGLWLPPGGHVNQDEHPRDTVRRECLEELRAPPRFLQNAPLFLTIAETIGAQPHEDVSLWYGLQGDCARLPDFDPREYRDMRWFRFAQAPFDESDPHLERFLHKLCELQLAA